MLDDDIDQLRGIAQLLMDGLDALASEIEAPTEGEPTMASAAALKRKADEEAEAIRLKAEEQAAAEAQDILNLFRTVNANKGA